MIRRSREINSPLKSSKSVEPKVFGQYGGSRKSILPRNDHKLWPSSKGAGDDDVIKYSPGFPACPQHMGRGESAQERALNAGVLDWDLLEKWTYNQKIVAAGKGADSPSNACASSSFSSFSSSSHSDQCISSILSQKKQTSSSSQSHTTAEDACKHAMGVLDTMTATHIPVGLHSPCHIDLHVSADHARKEQPDGKRNGTVASPQLYAINDTSREYEKSKSCEKSKCAKVYEKQSSLASVLASDGLHTEQLAASTNSRTMWDHLQDTVGRRVGSSESTLSHFEVPQEVNRSSYSGENFSGNALSNDQSPYGPHSCPLLCNSVAGEALEASNPVPEHVAATMKLNGKNENHKKFTHISSESFRVIMAEESDKDVLKAIGLDAADRRREAGFCHKSRPSFNWMEKSSSLREGSFVPQMKSVTSSDRPQVNNANPDSKGRQSPLRRLLDPFVKPKNRSSGNGSMPGSAVHNTYKQKNADKPPCEQETSDGPEKAVNAGMNASIGLSFSHVVSRNSLTSTLGEKHDSSRRQALVRLSWKNGLPLLMFSSNNNDVLVATVSRKSISDKDDIERVYKIFSVREVKKKSGMWIHQGAKNTKHSMVSNVVGQIKVSSRVSTDGNSGTQIHTREFVLFGAESGPTSHGPTESVFDKELAAVILKFPVDNRCNDRVGSSLIEQDSKSLSTCSIVAILPSGVHGSSATGEPSPLIERWKSGGFCDCGGWDEGCMLQVLCDKLQQNINYASVQGCSTTESNHRIQLFLQDGTRRSKYSYSMVAFREGLYMVELGASIALLHGFTLAIAAFHCKINPTGFRTHSGETNSSQEHVFADHNTSRVKEHGGEHHKLSVPTHPPLSPVGRA